jgi:hypothetical protein
MKTMNKIYAILVALIVIPALQLSAQSNVTFRVDITDYLAEGNELGANGIRIGGDFGSVGASIPSWTPSAPECALTQVDGTNIWTITVAFPESAAGQTLPYKFVNNDWGTNEGLEGSQIATDQCGTDDGGGNINRALVIPATDATIEFCWDRCDICAVASVSETTSPFTGVTVFPNPANDFVNIQFEAVNAGNFSIEVYNSLGQRMVLEQLGFRTSGIITHQMNLSAVPAGVYFVKLNNGTESIVRKVSVN